MPWAVSGVSTLVRGLAPVGVVGAGQQQAGELAVGAGRGLEADVRQAADLAQRLLQQPHQLQRPLGPARVLGRVQAGVAGQRRDPLVEARVVLHRAGAERVEAGVEVEVAPREAVVVADDLRLGDLRQAAAARRAGALAGISSSSGGSGTSGVGQRRGAAAGLRLLVDRLRRVRAASASRASARSRRPRDPSPLATLAAGRSPRRAHRRARRSARACGAR